jgi:hypothetical protein
MCPTEHAKALRKRNKIGDALDPTGSDDNATGLLGRSHTAFSVFYAFSTTVLHDAAISKAPNVENGNVFSASSLATTFMEIGMSRDLQLPAPDRRFTTGLMAWREKGGDG